MKRVQMLLEEWQYEWLQQEAKKQSISSSSLLRKLLTDAIKQWDTYDITADPLWDAIGIGEGPMDGISSENLDEYLYRTDWHERDIPARNRETSAKSQP
jgi:hypothetical protein